MDLEQKLARVKELTAIKEKAEAELLTLFGGADPPQKRKPPVCGKCGTEGHRSNACTQQD